MRAGFGLQTEMAKPALDFEEVEVPRRVAFHARQQVFRLLCSALGERHTNRRIPPRPLVVVGMEAAPLGDHAEGAGMWADHVEGRRS